MFEMKLVAALVAVVHAMLVCVVKCQTIQCSIEFLHGVSGTTFVWYSAENGTHVSSPLCLDASYNVVRRSCLDGSWRPKHVDNCYKFECPRYFKDVDPDKCSHLVPHGDACPDLSSDLAGHTSSGMYSPKPCVYGAEEFLRNEKVDDHGGIVLQFAFVTKLHLAVYNPEALETVRGKFIRCFSSRADLQDKMNRRSAGLTRLFRSNFTDGSSRNYAVYEVEIEDDPAEYWCQAFEIGRVRPVTTRRVVAHHEKKKKKGGSNEYSLLLENLGGDGLELIGEICAGCRLMEVSSFTEKKSALYLLHLTADAADDVAAQFSALKADLEARAQNKMRLISFKSSSFCLPQVATLNWKLTAIGSVGFPDRSCLDDPETIGRRCAGGFLHGAEWEPEKPCAKTAPLPEPTQSLTDVTSPRHVDFKNLSDIVDSPRDFTSADVALMADGYQRAQVNSTLDFLRSMSKIMNLSRSVLETSQKYYNTTDKLLDVIDKVIVENRATLKPVREKNLSVVTWRPFKDDCVGAAFYKHNAVKKIFKGQSVPSENLEAVVITPRDLLDALAQDLSPQKKEDFEIVMTGFGNAGGRVINVAVSDLKSYWLGPTGSFLGPRAPVNDLDYGFWDYGRNVFNMRSVHSSFAPNLPVIISNHSNPSFSDNSYLILTAMMIFRWRLI